MERWGAIAYDDVGVAKPAPGFSLRVTEMLGVAPAEAVALEDSPNGVAAAKAAGLWCVAAPDPLTKELDLSRARMCVCRPSPTCRSRSCWH